MRRILFVRKEDKKALKRLAKKNKTSPYEELHRILSYYFYVANTRKRLDIGKAKHPKIVRDPFHTDL